MKKNEEMIYVISWLFLEFIRCTTLQFRKMLRKGNVAICMRAAADHLSEVHAPLEISFQLCLFAPLSNWVWKSGKRLGRPLASVGEVFTICYVISWIVPPFEFNMTISVYAMCFVLYSVQLYINNIFWTYYM